PAATRHQDQKPLPTRRSSDLGWEIHNARMDENESALKNSAFTYQDIRDDRVYTYFDLHTNESKTFTLLLNAAYEGKYYLPAVNIESEEHTSELQSRENLVCRL